MIGMLVGHDAAVAQWVGERIGIRDFGAYTALGILSGDQLIAGVVFNNWRPPGIEVTMASTSPRWCTRSTLAAIFWYVFEQIGCKRLTALTEAKNQPVRAFLCHLGFQQEGLLRYGFPTDDAVIYGMLKEECRWLRTKETPRRCAA
jgi:RimJ/RimL family protein N-acetyltransferase